MECVGLQFTLLPTESTEGNAAGLGKQLFCSAGDKSSTDAWEAHPSVKDSLLRYPLEPSVGFKECDCSSTHFQKATKIRLTQRDKSFCNLGEVSPFCVRLYGLHCL